MEILDNIDVYSIVTNGLIASDAKYFILDPLGYYVIKVEEPDEGGGGGAPYAPSRKGEKEKKRKKKIRLTVYSKEEGINFVKEIELDDVNLVVKDVKLEEGKLVLEVYNPLLESSKPDFVRVNFDKISVNVTSVNES
jgi:hypothetical protein